MTLEEVATLIEREHRLHQEWLGALTNLETYLIQSQPINHGEVTMLLQDIMGQLSETQREVLEYVTAFSIFEVTRPTTKPDPLYEHILSLYESIEVLQDKITRKHQDLRMYHPIHVQTPQTKPVQLALDCSMDLLKNLVNSPR